MAITNAQQYQQLVNKPADGKRPGYRGKGEYQGGKRSSSSKTSSKSSNTGYTGGGGGGKDMGLPGQDRPSFQPPGFNINTQKFEKPDGTREDSYTPPTKKEIDKIFEEKEEKKKSFLETYNEKRKKKNLEYIQNLRNKKFKGIMNQYGLTEEQLNTLLEGDDEFTGGRNLTFTGLQQLLDMDPSARNLGEDFNEALMKGKLGALEMSPRMKKGVGLSTAELFSTTDPTTRIDLPGILGKVQGDENFSNLLSGLNGEGSPSFVKVVSISNTVIIYILSAYRDIVGLSITSNSAWSPVSLFFDSVTNRTQSSK